MNSPWGSIQHTEPVAPGIAWVSTASHGGLRIADTFAGEHLSEAARRRAISAYGQFWFEEDCLYAVAAYELPDLWPAMFHLSSDLPASERRAELLHTISTWHADYLLERGIKPEPTGYAFWLLWEFKQRLRELRHSDPQTATRLAPDVHVQVEIWDGCCTSVGLAQDSLIFLRGLGITIGYQVQDHDILEEKAS
ncbi:MAG: hypothetical protein JXM73_13895 [Anaerolineae bacterium]|nr:hypothetical protein [Anaerolineae bacterium]